MRWTTVLWLLALSTCAPPQGLEAKAWTVKDFLALPADRDLGGWKAGDLVAREGEIIKFRDTTWGHADVAQGPGYGLTAFPAFVDGEPASFLVTEIWFAHPTPWVQPGWIMVSELGGDYPPVKGTLGIFPVGDDATFYSPFWRQVFVLAPGASRDTYRNAKEVLDAQKPMQEGAVVYCPLAPADGGVVKAAGEDAGVHPWILGEDVGLAAGAPVGLKEPLKRTAWIDGVEAPYFGMGPGRVRDGYNGVLPEESALYTFVVDGPDGGPQPLMIPAVLQPSPFERSFVRRIDVKLPAHAAVFVPEGFGRLGAELAAAGAPHVEVPTDEGTARARRGAVIRDVQCLTPDAGLSGCVLLDSEAEILTLGDAYVSPSQTTLAIDVVQAGGRTP